MTVSQFDPLVGWLVGWLVVDTVYQDLLVHEGLRISGYVLHGGDSWDLNIDVDDELQLGVRI